MNEYEKISTILRDEALNNGRFALLYSLALVMVNGLTGDYIYTSNSFEGPNADIYFRMSQEAE
jgi:hypothetical protein